MTKPRLWTRDFMIVSALNFLLILVFYLLVVVIGFHATHDLGASVSQAGLVVGVFIIGVLAGRLLIGQFIDKLGRKRSMLAGLVLAVITSILYYVDAGISFLIANRLLHGIAVGVAATAIATVVAHLIPISRRGEGIGYFSMSTSLATAIGPFIGIFMMQHTGFGLIVAVCCGLSVLCFIVGLILRVPELEQQHTATHPGFSLTRLVEPKVAPLCTIVFLIGVYYSSVLSYLSAYAVERNLSHAASFFFIVYAVTLLISRPLSGRLLDKRGANVIMYPGFVFLAIGLLILGTATSAIMLLSAACLIGLGFGNMQSCTQAIVIKLVDSKQLSLATSTFFIFMDAGLGFGPYFLGLTIPHLGFSTLYQLLGLASLLSALVYYGVHGRKAANI